MMFFCLVEGVFVDGFRFWNKFGMTFVLCFGGAHIGGCLRIINLYALYIKKNYDKGGEYVRIYLVGLCGFVGCGGGFGQRVRKNRAAGAGC